MPERPLNRILYIEDEEDIQRIARLALERIGKFTVEVVGDPLKAMDAIAAFGPDLVLLDWMMPGMDGPTLFRRLREDERTKRLPVVFVTAKASAAELAELQQLGAAGTISKPFAPNELPDQLRAIWNALPD
ncbi:MAG: response regulator [Burkholderiales bacterium]|nr:response regulator [Burkholderiales bacterium]